MQIIYLNNVSHPIDYPIGLNLNVNLPIIKEMAEAILKLNKEYILLCCSGNSGSIIAGIVSSILFDKGINCKISYIKKGEESRHSYGDLASNYKNFTSVMVDDFIATGCTLERVNTEYKKQYGRNLDCICTSTYENKPLRFNPLYLICLKERHNDV